MTTVGRACEKFIEASWLVAVVLVVIHLNPFSDQVFEPDKTALLRMLVILMIAARVIRSLDGDALPLSQSPRATAAGKAVERAQQALFDNPITGLALLLLLVDLASTITSVSPRISWWGSYQRAQGTYTLLAYLGLFFAALAVLRRKDQLDRLISVLLITSFPVALYAILQRYGMSLLQFSEAGVESRVISTLGNAIFLAAYLAMVVPLTLWRLIESARARSRWHIRAIATGLYGGLLVLQLAAIWFTQSRGPVLGLLAELFVFALLVALLRRQRRWALAGLLVVAGVFAFLFALNVPGLPTDSLRSLPFVRRFAELAGAGARTLKARTLAWDTVLKALRTEAPRLVLGYGPETMKATLTRFMPAELWVLQGGGQYGTFDRAHNAVFDALYTRGIAGVVVYLLLYGVVFHQGLRWLGLVRGRREAGRLAGLMIAGLVLGVLGPWLWRGDLVLAALGVPVGMLGGLILFLLAKVMMPRDVAAGPVPADTSMIGGAHGLLVAALLAAIVGHFVETQTGIAIASTQLYFWLYTALVILLGTGRIGGPEPTQGTATRSIARGRARRSRRARRPGESTRVTLLVSASRPAAAMALVVAVLLGSLSYAFVHGFNVPGARGPAQVLIGVTWLFAGTLVLLQRYLTQPEADSLGSDAWLYMMTSLAWVVPFALYHRVSAQALDRLDGVYVVFVVWLLLAVAAIAAMLQWGDATPRLASLSSRLVVSYLMIMLLALSLAWRVDVRRVRADIHEKVGRTAIGAGLWDQAIPNLAQAVALQPWQDQYYIYLGGAYVEQARLLSDPAMKDMQMERALQILAQGQALAPGDSDQYRQLGLAYRVWADWAQDEVTRQQRLQRSLRYYLDAVSLNPQNPDLRLDLADAYFVLGINEEALGQYQHAVAIGSPSHLGRAYAGLGDIYLLRGQLEKAVEAYQQAMQAGRDQQEVLDSRIRAASNHPDDIQVRLSLALVYAAANRWDAAMKELNTAREMASSDPMRAEVEALIAMVERRK